jgi:hypothetical protein
MKRAQSRPANRTRERCILMAIIATSKPLACVDKPVAKLLHTVEETEAAESAEDKMLSIAK